VTPEFGIWAVSSVLVPPDFPTASAPRRQVHRATGRGGRAGGKRRWPKRLLIGVVLFLTLIVAVGAGGWFFLNSELNGIPRFKVRGITPETSGQPIDILLVGSDSRAFVTSSGQVDAFGNPAVQTGQRSDVVIIVRLVPRTRQIEMLSIPRDTYVTIAGTGGQDRINASFNGGPSQLVQTIQQNFGIPINHVVVANFPGFSSMVQALGGISLKFPNPLRDAYTGLDITSTGCQSVNGTQALALVRSRHLYYFANGAWNYDGMSDWSRIRRQQAFFHAVINKANSEFPNVLAINRFVSATVKDLSVDQGFSAHEMISLGLQYRGLPSSNLVTKVLPTYGTYVNGNAVLMPAQPSVHQVVASFLAVGKATGSSGSGGGTKTTTTVPATATTVPASQVVFDNQHTLPEPWNPKPC
jgi:LCP family protein required for cell wall assembly